MKSIRLVKLLTCMVSFGLVAVVFSEHLCAGMEETIETDVEVKAKLKEAVLKFVKNEDDSEEALKKVLLANKEFINADLDFQTKGHTKGAGGWMSFFGESEQVIDLKMKMSVMEFVLLYAPEKLVFFENLEKENKGIQFELNEVREGVLNSYIKAGLEPRGNSDKEALEKRVKGWGLWLFIKQSLTEEVVVRNYEMHSREEADAVMTKKRKEYMDAINSMAEELPRDFMKEEVDAKFAEVKEEYEAVEKKALLGRLENILKDKDMDEATTFIESERLVAWEKDLEIAKEAKKVAEFVKKEKEKQEAKEVQQENSIINIFYLLDALEKGKKDQEKVTIETVGGSKVTMTVKQLEVNCKAQIKALGDAINEDVSISVLKSEAGWWSNEEDSDILVSPYLYALLFAPNKGLAWLKENTEYSLSISPEQYNRVKGYLENDDILSGEGDQSNELRLKRIESSSQKMRVPLSDDARKKIDAKIKRSIDDFVPSVRRKEEQEKNERGRREVASKLSKNLVESMLEGLKKEREAAAEQKKLSELFEGPGEDDPFVSLESIDRTASAVEKAKEAIAQERGVDVQAVKGLRSDFMKEKKKDTIAKPEDLRDAAEFLRKTVSDQGATEERKSGLDTSFARERARPAGRRLPSRGKKEELVASVSTQKTPSVDVTVLKDHWKTGNTSVKSGQQLNAKSESIKREVGLLSVREEKYERPFAGSTYKPAVKERTATLTHEQSKKNRERWKQEELAREIEALEKEKAELEERETLEAELAELEALEAQLKAEGLAREDVEKMSPETEEVEIAKEQIRKEKPFDRDAAIVGLRSKAMQARYKVGQEPISHGDELATMVLTEKQKERLSEWASRARSKLGEKKKEESMGSFVTTFVDNVLDAAKKAAFGSSKNADAVAGLRLLAQDPESWDKGESIGGNGQPGTPDHGYFLKQKVSGLTFFYGKKESSSEQLSSSEGTPAKVERVRKLRSTSERFRSKDDSDIEDRLQKIRRKNKESGLDLARASTSTRQEVAQASSSSSSEGAFSLPSSPALSGSPELQGEGVEKYFTINEQAMDALLK